MEQIIIHVDMDAFFASVEARDNPTLRGKPLIIGSLPTERGVVSTCSYEARKFGVHSAMNIKDAYKLCPDGIYMHPNFAKYKEVSDRLHDIWDSYASASETVALDEAYLDVTEIAGNFDRAREIAKEIKRRTAAELGLTCSVGLAYSKAAAKTASEEKKPDGYYEILTPQDFMDLVIDRDVKVLFSVGKRTADKLYGAEIYTVSNLLDREDEVIELLGRQGSILIQLARGIDGRKVIPYRPEDAKSISRELTFQRDVHDYKLLEDVLLLMSMSVVERAKRHRLHGNGVVLKITFSNMRSITRSKASVRCDDALSIHRAAVGLLSTVKKQGVRLIGVGIYNLSSGRTRQTTLDEDFGSGPADSDAALEDALKELGRRYGIDFVGDRGYMHRMEDLHGLAEEMRLRRIFGRSLSDVFSRDAGRVSFDLFRRAGRNYRPALLPSARPHVDDIIGVPDDVEVMLYHYHSRPGFYQGLEDTHEHLHIQRMESDGRLVEHEDGVSLPFPEFAGKLQALGFPSGQARRGFA